MGRKKKDRPDRMIVYECIKKNPLATYLEIATMCGLFPNDVRAALEFLRREGMVEFEPVNSMTSFKKVIETFHLD